MGINQQTFNKTQGIPTNQDHIIYKILENSFIPTGNVNQTRRISSKGSDFGIFAQTGEFHDVFKEFDNCFPAEMPVQEY